jgi:hypothetical protein
MMHIIYPIIGITYNPKSGKMRIIIIWNSGKPAGPAALFFKTYSGNRRFFIESSSIS